MSYYRDGEQKAGHVRLIDTEHTERNSFIVADEWTVVGHTEAYSSSSISSYFSMTFQFASMKRDPSRISFKRSAQYPALFLLNRSREPSSR